MEVWQIIVLLGLCLLVYAFLLPKNKQSSNQSDLLRQMEETMEHYTQEMEEDNQKLISHISSLQNDSEKNKAQLLGRIESLEHQNHTLQHQVAKLSSQASTAPQAAGPLADHKTNEIQQAQAVNSGISNKNNAVIEKEEVKSDVVSSMGLKVRYSDLFQLHDQGKSVEYIAKKMGMNKGEIQLILQLARQEEQQGV
jgi:hypothetical protein